ncbi:MAG: nucleotidyltransferase family protein, partial [Candidatus Micrarchaeota archaeon]|nr:nucleotidyltransferase family protein [Candidatus Micrarchaeota archaeon]
MDIILLAGGFGTRMEPISSFIPKALLPIGGRPIIDHIIEDLARHKEVDRIIIDTNERFRDQFEYFMHLKGAESKMRFELVVEPTKSNGEKLGQIKGIEYVLKKADVESDFMVVSTDNYFDFGLGGVIKHFEKSRKPTFGMFETDSMELLTRSGVARMEEDRVVELEEKPAKPKSNLLSMGIYAFPKGSIGL